MPTWSQALLEDELIRRALQKFPRAYVMAAISAYRRRGKTLSPRMKNLVYQRLYSPDAQVTDRPVS